MAKKPIETPKFTPFDPRFVDLDIYAKAVLNGWAPFAQWNGMNGTESLDPAFTKWATGQLFHPYAHSDTTRKVERPKDIVDFAQQTMDTRFRTKNAGAVGAMAELIQPPTAEWTKTVDIGVSRGVVWRIDDSGKLVTTDDMASPDNIAVALYNGTTAMIFNLYPQICHSSFDMERNGHEVCFSGHTCFKGDKGWYNFSPRGVSDSFYGGDTTDIEALIIEQLAKVAESVKQLASMIPVPGTKWQMDSRKLEEYKRRLKAGLAISFSPHGFGVGNVYSTKPAKWGRQASPETAKFFGVPALWVEDTDCD